MSTTRAIRRVAGYFSKKVLLEPTPMRVTGRERFTAARFVILVMGVITAEGRTERQRDRAEGDAEEGR
jgi:hypothetical protein